MTCLTCCISACPWDGMRWLPEDVLPRPTPRRCKQLPCAVPTAAREPWLSTQRAYAFCRPQFLCPVGCMQKKAPAPLDPALPVDIPELHRHALTVADPFRRAAHICDVCRASGSIQRCCVPCGWDVCDACFAKVRLSCIARGAASLSMLHPEAFT